MFLIRRKLQGVDRHLKTQIIFRLNRSLWPIWKSMVNVLFEWGIFEGCSGGEKSTDILRNTKTKS